MAQGGAPAVNVKDREIRSGAVAAVGCRVVGFIAVGVNVIAKTLAESSTVPIAFPVSPSSMAPFKTA